MCLIALPGQFVRVAESDIPVFKVLNKKETQEGFILTSPYRGYTYKLGKVYKSGSLKLSRRESVSGMVVYEVEEGLHSYISYDAAVEDYCPITSQVFKAVIPVGSQYVLGTGDKIVSNRIAITSKVC